VVTHGSRTQGFWKGDNQDAFAMASPADGTLLLGVFDGHSKRGEDASKAGAEGITAALPGLLPGASGSAAGPAPGTQQRLVSAFQQVAASMHSSGAFAECGAAAVLCLVQPDRSVDPELRCSCCVQTGAREGLVPSNVSAEVERRLC